MERRKQCLNGKINYSQLKSLTIFLVCISYVLSWGLFGLFLWVSKILPLSKKSKIFVMLIRTLLNPVSIVRVSNLQYCKLEASNRLLCEIKKVLGKWIWSRDISKLKFIKFLSARYLELETLIYRSTDSIIMFCM